MGYKTYTCPASKKCGGCEWLSVPYPIQLDRKQKAVEEYFEGLGEDVLLYPIIGMDKPIRCRNKIVVPFAPGPNGSKGNGGRPQNAKQGGKRDGNKPYGKPKPSMKYGLYARGSHRIVPKPDCLVEDEMAYPIVESIAKLARSFRIPPYDEDAGTGFLRYVLLRIARGTGQVLVCLVCAGDVLRSSKAFVNALRKEHPEITTVVLNVNKRNTNAVLGQKEHVLYGKGYIVDKLMGCTFKISATSFYQVNPLQTERLYDSAISMAGLTGSETILDAYCGTGTIGIVASKRHGCNLIGVESNAQAVKDARGNARANGVENAEFFAEDAGKFMDEMAANGEKADVVFMDPPRSGSDERFLGSLARMAPKKVVYVSCNPETQARDIDYLLDHGYSLKSMQPVDMFPHTSHIENVALLERSGKKRRK